VNLTQEKISSICDSLTENIEEVLNHFEIEFVEFPNRIAFACPIHGGDNPEGCCIFTDGMTTKGNWHCWTRFCHEEYANNMFGFVRGILSERAGRSVTMQETEEFCKDLLNQDFDNIQFKPKKSNSLMEIFNRSVSRDKASVSREDIVSRIAVPSDYYQRRGYTSDILIKFDVGECFAKNQPMSDRVVVPIYDEDYNYIGCVGRSIKEHVKPKWLHSKGFTKNSLYGLHVAKDRIMETGTVVLVEGQGDVWRLHESGLDMAVGIFGASINEDQLILLEQSGAMNVVILTDYDEAGTKASEQIIKKCGRRFNYVRPEIDHIEDLCEVKDVGDMTIEQIKTHIIPQLKGIKI